MSKSSSFFYAIRDIVLVVLLLVIGVSYHPTIVDMSRMAGYESGTILSRYIVMLFVGVLGLSLLSTSISIMRSKTIKYMIVWMLIIGVTGVAAVAIYNNNQVIEDLKSLAIVLGAMVIGWKLEPSRKLLYILFLTFVGSVFFSGISQVLINVGGFVIEDYYLADAKNSLGALLATATLILLFIAHDTKVRILRSISIAGVALGLLLLLVIRARMAFLTAVLLIVYYIFLLFRSSKYIIVVVLLVPALLVGYLLIPGSVFDFLGESMTAGTQGEDFTSGRMDIYMDALDIFARSPLLGNITQFEQIGWVHNFPLLKLSSYGLLFSWPILVLYCILLWKLLSRSFMFEGRVSFFNLLLLVPFMISLAEPTFPFGPGTVTVFNFLLFGIADKDMSTISAKDR